MLKSTKKSIVYGSLIAIALLSAGCGGNKLEVTKYSTKINKKASVPEICKPEYKSMMPRVAVVNFTNNSTFGKANIDETNKDSSAFIGVGFIGGGFGAGGESKSKSINVKREVDAKLSESIVPIVESMISQTGGATLVSRNDLDKINDELKLQDSGLLDPESVVQMGKMTGVQFLVTGSINNVEMDYTDNSKAGSSVAEATKNSDNDAVKMIGSLISLGTSLTDGMDIKTTYTLRIVDVESGRIVLSEELEGSTNIGKIKEPTFDQIVGAIKKNINDSLPKLKEQFARYFSVKGYITQIRSDGSDMIVQVNIGSKQKVVENQLFDVYIFEENADPISGNVSCDRLITPIKLRATNQIMADKTWTTVEEGDAEQLQLYQLIQKSHEKAGFEIPKLSF